MHTIFKTSIFILLFCFLVLPVSVNAEHYSYGHHNYHGYWIGKPGSGEAMIADALVARPVGLVTTVAGSAVYIVSLPFSLLGGNEKQARQKLVVEPARYTFKRPLGAY